MFKKLLRHTIVWFTRTSFYSWLLIKVIPYIRFTTYYTSLRGFKYVDGYKHLQPGDIILTKDKKKLTTLLIGGEFTHAAICVGKYGTENYPGFEVAEMTHTHYTTSHFFDLCKESDSVVILRAPQWTEDYKKEFIAKCLSFKNARYDVDFDLGVEQLYCSELVYQSDFKRTLELNLEDIAGLGTKYISPTGLYKSPSLVTIWNSDHVGYIYPF